MRDAPPDPARRAGRLLRWYPKNWRARYGEEFEELLVAEICECPRSWRRSADVVRGGLMARLANGGLTGHPMEPADRVRASLATLGYASGVFLAFGVAMWSQLIIGWRWSEPDAHATYVAMILMSAAMLLFGLLAVLAAIPIASCVLHRIAGHRSPGLAGPSLLFLAAGAFLIIGSHHFGNGWPGTGGHPWAQQGLVPGGVAAFTWASTLSVTSYWAHPAALLSFPAAELSWMAASPVAIVGLVAGAARIVRRADLPPRVLRYETGLARVAALGMIAFLGGSCGWVIYGAPGPGNLFHTGTIDLAGLVVMGLALAVAHRAVHQARRRA